MLEERLSSTYSQHNFGNYGSHATRPSSNIYPSIPQNIAGGHGPAESFYTGVSTAPSDVYGYSGSRQDSYAPARSTYATYDRNMSMNAPSTEPGTSSSYSHPQQGTYDQQWAPGYQSYPPTQRQDSQNFSESKGQAYNNQSTPLPSPMPAPSAHPPHQIPMSPVQSVTSYYEEPQSTASSYQQQPQQSTNSTYPGSQPSPEQYHQNLPQQPPFLPQPSYQPPPIPQTLPPPSQQPQQQQQQQQHQQHQAPTSMQPYWQQPQFSQPSQSRPTPQPNIPYPTMNNYTQESFPSAPNHQPQPMPVEEALIEL